MASKATSLWRSVWSRVGIKGNQPFATSTIPKMRSSFPPIADYFRPVHDTNPRAVKGEFVPVYVAMGMILLSSSLGAYTGLLLLMYEPSVRLNKKKRETLLEVVNPDEVVNEAEQLITKSLFRKVAHIQEEFEDDDHGPYDPIRGDVFARPLKAETLKSVGVEPSLS